MERLVIVIDCPDDWRAGNRLTPEAVWARIGENLRGVGLDLPVRVRWQTMDTGAL